MPLDSPPNSKPSTTCNASVDSPGIETVPSAHAEGLRTTAAGLRKQRQPPTASPKIPTASDASLEPQEGEVWYFAFGSNMNSKILTGRRRVQPLSSVPCTVLGYQLDFNYRAIPYLEPGFATIYPTPPIPPTGSCAAGACHTPMLSPATTPSHPALSNAAPHGPAHALKADQSDQSNGTMPSSSMEAAGRGSSSSSAVMRQSAVQSRAALARAGLHGVAHLVTEAEWERIKSSEGVSVKGIGYQVISVKCDLYGGGWVTAYTLSAAPASLAPPSSVLPSRRYMQIIRDGAREHGLEPSYCAVLDAYPGYTAAPGPSTWIAWGVVVTFTTTALLAGLPLIFAVTTLDKVRNMATQLHGARHPDVTTPPTARQRSLPADPISRNSDGVMLPRKMTVGRRMVALRQQLQHPVVSYYLFAVTRALWMLHDKVLNKVLGSGCDHE
ncbi:hypothetical protein QJQ45_013749 [Haematococcus lacustris]|nr:hypothetical protein QJQ45_013749 [Haematococcus lacustris]